MAHEITPVPRAWVGETCVCIASGPSLTRNDVNYVHGKARTIVVNTSYRLALWADALWATDARWWGWHSGAPEFLGMKFSLGLGGALPADVRRLRNDGYVGLCHEPDGVRNGKNGGHAAVNLAVHFGVKRIVLLGYDMQHTARAYWHDGHPIPTANQYQAWRRHFATLIEPLRALDIELFNASRDTALECVPRVSLADALQAQKVVA